MIFTWVFSHQYIIMEENSRSSCACCCCSVERGTKWLCASTPCSARICAGSWTPRFRDPFLLPALPLTATDIYFPIFVWINAICWKLLCYQINKTYGPCLNTNEVVHVIISLGFWSCTEGGPGSLGCPYRGTPGCSGCAEGTGVGNVSYRSLWRKYQLFLYL